LTASAGPRCLPTAITLQLRSLWPDPVAESQLVFAPDDLQYGIKPGESKPVPPWCGLNSEP
jgi:hypothetical protein